MSRSLSRSMSRTAGIARNILPLFLLIALFVPFAAASGPYVIGSGNTVTADPLVPRPATTPCVVQLFSDAAFNNFNVENFTYTPPSACPGPWAKVVLESDINLNAGIQYDRTANYWLGPVNIFFGTTAEPGGSLGPSWHIESDLTDYSSLFNTTQSGQADIGNTLCCGLTSTIYASATLEFYPLAPGQAAPVVANNVYAISAGPEGGTITLNTSTSKASATFELPTNVTSAYLDVYSQGQSGDEFWYTCVPNNASAELESCGSTSFRETEITIDGTYAGVAPVFPWIFTGGIDPFLWYPIPGIQTLNFTPYRVNLTPFAGLLSNGKPHTVSLSVFNADSYFAATASLLVYTDPGAAVVTGAITKNTLTPPTPAVKENLIAQSTIVTGTVDVSSKRSFTISGYANTSQGLVTTTVLQTVNFTNDMFFKIDASQYTQDITQATILNSTVTTTTGTSSPVVASQNFNFPLTVDITETVSATTGDIDEKTTADQTYETTRSTTQAGKLTYSSSLSNAGQHVDTLEFDSSGNFLGNTGQSSGQQYTSFDSTGNSYNCSLSAVANALTAFSPNCAQ